MHDANDVDVIDQTTMREFDAACLTEVLPMHALAMVDELAATSGTPSEAKIARLLEATATVVAGCVEELA